MHEGGLCEGVLAVVLEAASERPVSRVQLGIGQLQRVVVDSFDFYWEMLAAETPAAGAAVEIEELPIRIRCRACSAGASLPDATFLCPACGSADVQVLSGDQVVVKAVELRSGELIRNPNLANVCEDQDHVHS
jgi:hydrogenase nickel incorporation protein HypA/HybF